MSNLVFWESWWLRGPGLEPGSQKGALRNEQIVNFGGHVGSLSGFLAVQFLVYFLTLPFSALGAVLEPQGGQKGGFGRSF